MALDMLTKGRDGPMWGQSQPPVPSLKMSVRDCTLSRRDLFIYSVLARVGYGGLLRTVGYGGIMDVFGAEQCRVGI